MNHSPTPPDAPRRLSVRAPLVVTAVFLALWMGIQAQLLGGVSVGRTSAFAASCFALLFVLQLLPDSSARRFMAWVDEVCGG